MLWPNFTWNIYIGSHIHVYLVFQLTSWSLNWMTFDLGWPLKVKLGIILNNSWINFTFGKLLTWTGINNDNIWLPPIGYKSDFEQYSNRLYLFSFGKLLTELAYIMTTYDFLWAKPWILSNIWTNFSLIHFNFWSTFHMNWNI